MFLFVVKLGFVDNADIVFGQSVGDALYARMVFFCKPAVHRADAVEEVGRLVGVLPCFLAGEFGYTRQGGHADPEEFVEIVGVYS